MDTRGTLDYLRRREARAMITGLYIDHFKTFQNFEWKPGPVALLMGRNGAGKTAAKGAFISTERRSSRS